MQKPYGTVLVVEDEVLIRLAAVDLVKSAGFEAVEAKDADEAIRIMEVRVEVSLVFTNIDMPGSMDGLKLTRYIRERWPRVLLIVASGKTIQDRSQLPEGVTFFPKPYAEQAIAEAIIGMLSSGHDGHAPASARILS